MRDGHIIAERYFNGETAQTLHDVRSAGKSITSLLVGIAIDRRRLHGVDDRVDAYWPEARGSAIARLVAAAGRRTCSTTSRPPSVPACATTWMPGSVSPGPLLATGTAPALEVADPVPAGEPDVASDELGALEDPVGGLAAEGPGAGVRPNAQSAPTPRIAARTRPRTRCTTTERGTNSPPTRCSCPFCRTLAS
jgi:hypothetical protein